MSTGVEESPVRGRTRTAILRAAVEVLATEGAASMEEVALAAGVVRSTLHRYYPDRASLIGAVSVFVGTEYAAALARARPGDGSGLAAYTRICAELLDGLSVFIWWMRVWNEQQEIGDDDRLIADVLERGQRDGSVASDIDSGWLAYRVWAELYAAYHYVNVGGRSQREVREACLRTLVNAVAAESHAARSPASVAYH